MSPIEERGQSRVDIPREEDKGRIRVKGGNVVFYILFLSSKVIIIKINIAMYKQRKKVCCSKKGKSTTVTV